jgi:hypothetical protein
MSEIPGITIVSEQISEQVLRQIAAGVFGDMVKAVVDVRRRTMAIGGELHADEETLLLERGSAQEDLWGINIYPDKPRSEWIEFDSIINIRPRQHNRSRYVEDASTREVIAGIVTLLIL